MMEISGPAYRIQTQRLIVRCWHPGDASLLSTAIAQSLEHLQAWMPWAHAEPKSLQQRIDWLREARGEFDLNQNFLYGVFDLAEEQVLGATGLHPRVGKDAFEIGYWIHANYINQGFASEAASALTRVAFEVHQAVRVEIRCDPQNLRSAAVPQKLGFIHEATLRQRVEDHAGRKRDSMIWSLFATDYPASKAASIELEAYDVVGRKLLY